MAYASDKKPLELTALTELATDDTIIVGDTSDTTEVTKSITKANLITTLGVGSGDVTGAASSTDNAVAKFDSTTGKIIQDSNLVVDDNGNVTARGYSRFGNSANAYEHYILSNTASTAQLRKADGTLAILEVQTLDTDVIRNAGVVTVNFDSNTSVPAADFIVTQGANEQFRVLNSGGIEVTGNIKVNPSAAGQVLVDGDTYASRIRTADGGGVYWEAGVTADPTSFWTLDAAGGQNNLNTKGRNFQIRSTSQTDIIKVMNATGNVGINETAPSDKLDIVVSDTDNVVGLGVTQSDVTNNPQAVNIANAGSGAGIYIGQTGNGKALDITSSATTKPAIEVEVTGGDAHMRLVGDSGNATPTEGDLWRESDGLKYYDGSTEHNLIGYMTDLSDDTTPTLGGELDCGANSIGFTMQEPSAGDGTTTFDWGNGNHIDFTFGAQNETFTFTAPAKSGVYTLSLTQDSTGSRTVTWPASGKWAGGSAPTLTTTATTGYDIVSFRYDGTNYYGVASLDFS